MPNSRLATPTLAVEPPLPSPSPIPSIEELTPSYSNDIPVFYDQERLNYPCKPPQAYTDEEFERMNHFDFLHALSFPEPPVLPPYLNSNLLNDSKNKNYRAFSPSQGFGSGINEKYKYRINDLNVMDKYSTLKPTRPLLKRSGSSTSSSSSVRSSKNIRSQVRPKINRIESGGKVKRLEKSQVPHHVMLNHLITCNMNKDGYITSSCISRYMGRFITHIMYVPTEAQKPDKKSDPNAK